MELLKKLSLNEQGRDIAVGDVHGHFSKLDAELRRVNFNTRCDRLIFVGDLVDKGPESDEASDWLGYSWAHAVRGNHDDYVVRHATVQTENWRSEEHTSELQSLMRISYAAFCLK